MKPKDITGEFVKKLKPGTKLYDWFDRDNGSLILCDKTWWLERISYADTMSDAVHKQLERLMLKYYNATWLYHES